MRTHGRGKAEPREEERKENVILRVRGEKERGFRRHFVVKCLPGNYHVYDERHKVAADDDYAAERASVTCLQYNLKQMTRFPRPRFPPHTLFTDTRLPRDGVQRTRFLIFRQC